MEDLVSTRADNTKGHLGGHHVGHKQAGKRRCESLNLKLFFRMPSPGWAEWETKTTNISHTFTSHFKVWT